MICIHYDHNKKFGLLKFHSGYGKFYFNSPKGYSRTIINAQTVWHHRGFLLFTVFWNSVDRWIVLVCFDIIYEINSYGLNNSSKHYLLHLRPTVWLFPNHIWNISITFCVCFLSPVLTAAGDRAAVQPAPAPDRPPTAPRGQHHRPGRVTDESAGEPATGHLECE